MNLFKCHSHRIYLLIYPLKNNILWFLTFSVSKLSVSAGNTVELQLPKDETVLTCFVLEKENPGLSINFIKYQQIW